MALRSRLPIAAWTMASGATISQDGIGSRTQLQVLVLGQVAMVLDDAGQQLVQRDALAGRASRDGSLASTSSSEISCSTLRAVRWMRSTWLRAAAGMSGCAERQFRRTGDHRDRRAQFVAGDGDERMLALHEFLVAPQVVVEGIGDHHHFRARLRVRRRRFARACPAACAAISPAIAASGSHQSPQAPSPARPASTSSAATISPAQAQVTARPRLEFGHVQRQRHPPAIDGRAPARRARCRR